MFRPKTNHSAPREKRHCLQCELVLDTSNRTLFCDDGCRREYTAAQRRKAMLERRPKEVRCTYCEKPIDPLTKLPYELQKEHVFCNMVCVDAYRLENGHYQRISQLGNQAIKSYQDQHGKVPHYKKRADAVSHNNLTAPPKAKYFERRGKVWGYEVVFAPNGSDDGYLATLPEMPDLGTFPCITVKEGLLTIRAAIRGQIDISKEKAKKEYMREYSRKYYHQDDPATRAEQNKEYYEKRKSTPEGRQQLKEAAHRAYVKKRQKRLAQQTLKQQEDKKEA